MLAAMISRRSSPSRSASTGEPMKPCWVRLRWPRRCGLNGDSGLPGEGARSPRRRSAACRARSRRRPCPRGRRRRPRARRRGRGRPAASDARIAHAAPPRPACRERAPAPVQRQAVAAHRPAAAPRRRRGGSACTKPSDAATTSSLRLSPSRSTNSGEDATSPLRAASAPREAGQQVACRGAGRGCGGRRRATPRGDRLDLHGEAVAARRSGARRRSATSAPGSRPSKLPGARPGSAPSARAMSTSRRRR